VAELEHYVSHVYSGHMMLDVVPVRHDADRIAWALAEIIGAAAAVGKTGNGVPVSPNGEGKRERRQFAQAVYASGVATGNTGVPGDIASSR
jgi:hypothetical protein